MVIVSYFTFCFNLYCFTLQSSFCDQIFNHEDFEENAKTHKYTNTERIKLSSGNRGIEVSLCERLLAVEKKYRKTFNEEFCVFNEVTENETWSRRCIK